MVKRNLLSVLYLTLQVRGKDLKNKITFYKNAISRWAVKNTQKSCNRGRQSMWDLQAPFVTALWPLL